MQKQLKTWIEQVISILQIDVLPLHHLIHEGGRIRTRTFQLDRLILYQLSYSSKEIYLCLEKDLNFRLKAFQAFTLPTELSKAKYLKIKINYVNSKITCKHNLDINHIPSVGFYK